MDLTKIMARLSKIDPAVGMKNWEINMKGLDGKFKGSYPIAKNISDHSRTIDRKQFKIRNLFAALGGSNSVPILSKDGSNPKKCVRCAGPDCEITNCKKGILLCSNCGGGHSAAHKSCTVLKV